LHLGKNCAHQKKKKVQAVIWWPYADDPLGISLAKSGHCRRKENAEEDSSAKPACKGGSPGSTKDGVPLQRKGYLNTTREYNPGKLERLSLLRETGRKRKSPASRRTCSTRKRGECAPGQEGGTAATEEGDDLRKHQREGEKPVTRRVQARGEKAHEQQ